MVRKPAKPTTVPSVAELTRNIDRVLQAGIGKVRVRGEISGYKIAHSGHRYFTLKDSEAQIDCVLWGGREVAADLGDGLEVVVEGRLTVYAPRGKYQIDCTAVTAAGRGDLHAAFEALKQELAGRGWFDPNRKRPLPAFPTKIGVVTSPVGAAIRDILSTLERRAPHCTVCVCPARVQGQGAEAEIAAAIAVLQQTDAEVLIVGRGGGSIEDLWAFNTETVARAIVTSAIPVISAVGHETDFTIADFVADVRAATPTAAAELASQYPAADLIRHCDGIVGRLRDRLHGAIDRHRRDLERLTRSYALQAVPDRLRAYIRRVDEAELRLHRSVHRSCNATHQRLEAAEAQLRALDPLSPLRRGFALLRDGDRLLSASDPLPRDRPLALLRDRDVAQVQVLQIEPGNALFPPTESP